ncbi:hypothetical protein LX32DRAFT_261842 [Colletotrichum zoysiae]|uniref:Uncharacterized protein n=1 Tax=Colletotrichum zoysiae TaxID=1216348 RepID=A0AAD9HMI3_9PEZI|nr:hypothetical protein LX32DRAFT_261842 [Colletotrichum zoysiae]
MTTPTRRPLLSAAAALTGEWVVGPGRAERMLFRMKNQLSGISRTSASWRRTSTSLSGMVCVGTCGRPQASWALWLVASWYCFV